MIGFKIIAGILVSGSWLMAAEVARPSSSVENSGLSGGVVKTAEAHKKELKISKKPRDGKTTGPLFSEFSKELNPADIETLIRIIYEPLSYGNNIPEKQKRSIIRNIVNFYSKKRTETQNSSIGFYCPATSSAKNSLQKLLKNPSRSIIPGIYHFSNLNERFNGILKPREDAKKTLEKNKWGKILDGKGNGENDNERRLNTADRAETIYLPKTFNIAGIPIQEIIKLLKFSHPKVPNGLSWTQLPPKQLLPSITCSWAEKNFACGKDFNIFLKHLRGCKLAKMTKCISDAKESPQIREMLSDYWDYFWKDASQIPPEYTDLSSTESSDIPLFDQASVGQSPEILMFSINSKKYPSKEAFLKDDNVRENAVGIIILEHLLNLELYYDLNSHKKDHDSLVKTMKDMLQDVATLLAKIKIEYDTARVNGAVGNFLTGGIPKEAGRLLYRAINEEVENLKKEEAAREKAYKTMSLQAEKKEKVLDDIIKSDPKDALVKPGDQKDKSDSVDKIEASRKAYENRKAFAQLPGHVD